MSKTQKKTTRIHPTAIVEPGAELGEGVEIGPYCIVGSRTILGDGTCLHAHSQVLDGTTLGRDNIAFAGAVLGGLPQDRKFGGEQTSLVVGDRNHFREHCTVHIGTAPPVGSGKTRVGSDCLIMACSHVAHDCCLADGVTMGNNVLLAGHVHVEECASISGGSVVHQFATIGALAYVGGLARVPMDVPPYVIFEGRPGRPRGLNLIGLKRHGYTDGEIEELKEAYRLLFNSQETREEGLAELEGRARLAPQVAKFVSALRRSENGVRGRYLESRRPGIAAQSGRVRDAQGARGEG